MGIEEDIKKIKDDIKMIEARLYEIHNFLFEKKHGKDRSKEEKKIKEALKDVEQGKVLSSEQIKASLKKA